MLWQMYRINLRKNSGHIIRVLFSMNTEFKRRLILQCDRSINGCFLVQLKKKTCRLINETMSNIYFKVTSESDVRKTFLL